MKLTRGSKLDSFKPISDVEKMIGRKLPATYVQMVLDNDGGRPDPSSVTLFLPARGMVEEVECSKFIAFVDEIPGISMLEYNVPGSTPLLPDSVYAFGVDPGGYLFCFDYRRSEDPAVVLVVNDADEDVDSVIPVADDFDAFWSSLR
jgi:hypothetical protein